MIGCRGEHGEELACWTSKAMSELIGRVC